MSEAVFRYRDGRDSFELRWQPEALVYVDLEFDEAGTPVEIHRTPLYLRRDDGRFERGEDAGRIAIVRRIQERAHDERVRARAITSRSADHALTPLFGADPQNPRIVLFSEAGAACLGTCGAWLETRSRVVRAFAAHFGDHDRQAAKGAKPDPNPERAAEQAAQIARLSNFIEEINAAIRAARARRGISGPVEELAVPDPGGPGHEFLRRAATLSNVAAAAAVARALNERGDKQGKVLFELHRALQRMEGNLEAIIAPRGDPESIDTAIYYSDMAALIDGGVRDADELRRLAAINKAASDAERTLVGLWSAGEIGRPRIADDPRFALSPKDIFIGNLYAMATLRLGGSRGRYSAIAEIEVDELLRHIAREGNGRERRSPQAKADGRIVDLRPEKIALTTGKSVSDHGPDGIYDLTDDLSAQLRGVIHVDDGTLLLVSEVKTSVDQAAIGTSIAKVGGQAIAEARKGKKYPADPTPADFEDEALAYLLWAIGKARDLLAAKARTAIQKSKDASLAPASVAAWADQGTIWQGMADTLRDELKDFETQTTERQRAWLRDPQRRVASLLIVRACSLFGATVDDPTREWGDRLPPRATGLFDRTLVIDLYGLPVPELCYERRNDQAVPIESASQQQFFKKILEYNTYRFPELLRSAVAGGFEWGDDPEIAKALQRTGGK